MNRIILLSWEGSFGEEHTTLHPFESSKSPQEIYDAWILGHLTFYTQVDDPESQTTYDVELSSSNAEVLGIDFL